MAKFIQQGDMFGRIGTGIGKGLAEQLPQEMDRGRLAAGLNRFERDSGNLNPIQQLSRLAAIPGITPQTLQSFSELARFQNRGNAYRNAPGGEQPRSPMDSSSPMAALASMSAGQGGSQTLTPTQQARLFGDGPQREIGKMGVQGASAGVSDNLRRTPNVQSTDERVAEIAPQNPTTQGSLPRTPWTPERRDQTVSKYLDRGFLPDEASRLAADDERRDLEEAGALEQREKKLSERGERAAGEFRRQLESRLQKKGDNVFEDITGDMLLNMERGIERDLVLHPDLSYKDVANEWSNRALDLAKTNSSFRTTMGKVGLDSLVKGEQNLNKLRSYQEIYRKSGNLEEYEKMLRENGLSAQASSSIAFPVSKKIQSKLNGYKEPNRFEGSPSLSGSPQKLDAAARKIAAEIESEIGPDDSFLSIARDLSNKHPNFDQDAFFDQLNADRDRIRINQRQARELAEGARDILPSWKDFLIFPWFRRK